MSARMTAYSMQDRVTQRQAGREDSKKGSSSYSYCKQGRDEQGSETSKIEAGGWDGDGPGETESSHCRVIVEADHPLGRSGLLYFELRCVRLERCMVVLEVDGSSGWGRKEMESADG